MPSVRADAVRSREAILAVARRYPVDALRLNDVARDAGVGVGTVYRHFPTVSVLVEALACQSAFRMRALAAAAEAEPDAASALVGFIQAAVGLQLSDGGLQAILTAPDEALDEAREAKCEIMRSFARVLDRAKDQSGVRPELTVEQLHHLICGIEHAVRLGDPADRAVLLDVMLAGIRARCTAHAALTGNTKEAD